MIGNKELLRKIPDMNTILDYIEVNKKDTDIPHQIILTHARDYLGELRLNIIAGKIQEIPTIDNISNDIIFKTKRQLNCELKHVINGTGVILHTNLGRAIMSECVADKVKQTAMNYSSLEYDISQGKRGSRHDNVSKLLEYLTGCESAAVVNNNAAAVILTLSAMAKTKEVIVSRGELVEIGGSFRIPEIMEQSGAILREIGTTNKTNLNDYKNAIDLNNTAALLKVHTSNYRILGFTESVTIKQLSDLGKTNDIPIIYDLGGGALFNYKAFNKFDEPTVKESLEQGADIVCFSGDKLLGGPQAGIIVGKKKYIDLIKSHPLARALRIDKLCLAALEATLVCYLDSESLYEKIPTLQMLAFSDSELKDRAEKLSQLINLASNSISSEIAKEEGEVGGGSLPLEKLDTWCVKLKSSEYTANQIERLLRGQETPIVGRIIKDSYYLDVRTILTDEYEIIAGSLKNIERPV